MDAPEFDLTLTQKGLMWRHTPSGRMLPLISGGDGPNDPPAGQGGGDGGGQNGGQGGQGGDGSGGAADPTFSQADLDRVAGRARAEAQRAAQRELAEKLGLSFDDAKKIIDAHNEAEAKNKTEAERLRDEAAAAKAEADKAKADAAAERFASKVERKLAAAGVGKGLADEEAAKVMARAVRLVNLATDASDDELSAEIDALKADVPGLFAEAAAAAGGDGKKPTAPSGTTTSGGGAPPKGGQAGKSALERGAERWAAKNPQKQSA